MSKAIPLDEQIVATLTQPCTSDNAAAVLADAERLLSDLTKQADAADVASLSPLATTAQAREQRGKAQDIRFDADRLEASVAALSARLSEIGTEERTLAADAARVEVLAQRDTLAAEIAERYPRIVFDLTSLAKRIAENDELCRSHGIKGSAEAIGRGCADNFYAGGAPIHRIADIKIGMPDTDSPAWDDSAVGARRWLGLELAPVEA